MKITPPASAKTLKSSSDLLSGISKGEGGGANAALRKPKVRHGAQNRPTEFDQAVRQAGGKNDPSDKATEPKTEAQTPTGKPVKPIGNDSGEAKPSETRPDASLHDDAQPVDQAAATSKDKQSQADETNPDADAASLACVQVVPQRQTTAAKIKAAPAAMSEKDAGEAVGQAGAKAPQATVQSQADEEWVQRITGQALEGAGAVMRQIAGAKSSSVTAAARAGMTIAGAEDTNDKPAEIPLETGDSAQALPHSVSSSAPASQPVLPPVIHDRQAAPSDAPAPARVPSNLKESALANTSATPASASSVPDAPTPGTPVAAFSMVSQPGVRLAGSSKVTSSPTAPRSRDLPDQAAHALTVALHDLPAPAGERIVTMRLNPVAMGQLRIELHVAGDAVAVQIHAGSPKVRAALTKSLADLKSSVERQGLRVESMGVLEDRALAAPETPLGPDQALVNPDGGGNQGQDHAGSPFANVPRSIAGAEPPALHPAGDGVATLTPGVDEDGVLEILTYRLDAVA